MMSQSSCSKCMKPATLMCQRCQDYYCSSDCQIMDWKEHKSKCFQMPNLVPIKNRVPVRSVPAQAESVRRPIDSDGRIDQTPQRSRGGYGQGVGSTGGNAARRNLVRNPVLDDEDFAFKPPSVVKAWASHYMPPKDAFFDVLVQHVEETDPTVCWVIELQYNNQLGTLIGEINRNISQDKPCSIDEIRVGNLVAAPYKDVLHRAEILAVAMNPDSQFATLRLIDFGNKLRLPFSKLYAPITIMLNLNALAFRVCVTENSMRFEMGAVMTLRLKDQKHSKGLFAVEMKPKTLSWNLPMELLNQNPQVSLVKVLHGGRQALLQLNTFKNASELNSHLSSKQGVEYEFNITPVTGSFVAAYGDLGWRRACLLGFVEELQKFLVYLFDEGSMTFCAQIRKIPDAFHLCPIGVLAITTSSEQKALLKESELINKTLTLHLSPSCAVFNNKTKLLPCALHCDGQKLCEVVTSNFTGDLHDLHLNYWREPILDSSNIFITNVISHSKIVITSTKAKDYPKILTSLAKKCALFKSEEELVDGDVVLANIPNDDTYFRGKITFGLENTFNVQDLDSSTSYNISWKLLRKPNNFVRSMPVFSQEVDLVYLESIPNVDAESKALEILKECNRNAVEFIVKIGCNKLTTVELLYLDEEHGSLNKKLLPLLFEKRAECSVPKSRGISVEHSRKESFVAPSAGTVVTTVEPSVPKEEQRHLIMPNLEVRKAAGQIHTEVYTSQDLDFIPITIGQNVQLLVLDVSRIMDGYLTAADCTDRTAIRKMEENLGIVSKYCQCPHTNRGYTPKIDEICLAIFEDDGQWYRAICTSHLKNGTFSVVFIDYGNPSNVSKENVMPITKDLMFPPIANLCYMEGFTQAQAKKYANAVKDSSVIVANVTKKDKSNAYNITVCTMEQ